MASNTQAQTTRKGRSIKWGPLLGALLGPVVLLGLLVVMTGAPFEAATYGLALAGGALLFVLWSLYRMVQALARPDLEAAMARDLRAAGAGRRHLRDEKRRLLRALNELEFDFQMGKLSEADYKSVREAYELQAIEVLRALDHEGDIDPALQRELKTRGIVEGADAQPVEAGSDEPKAAEADDEVASDESSEGDEARAESRSEEPAPESSAEEPAPEAGNDDPDVPRLESRIPTEPRAVLQTCASCKASNDPDARFCKRCGAKLDGDDVNEKKEASS